MNDFFSGYGDWALVAGAADGIGAAFSESLARRGMNLIMADSNESFLHDLSAKLETMYGIKTVQLPLDLSEKKAVEKCIGAVSQKDCRLLVYVPSFSVIKPFRQLKESDLDLFLDLNCRTPLHLVHAFIKSTGKEKRCGILLLSSLAGMIGPPLSAVYAGTKAFNIILAESLNSELKDHVVDITVCCAGMTSTPTFWSSKPKIKSSSSNIMQPGTVAEYALKRLGKKTICIPGWKNRLSFNLLLRLLSRKTSARIVNRAMQKMYFP